MAKYIPPEQMTIQQIQSEIDQAFQQWNDIASNGCQDPIWPDGTNMNIVRNHIIFWYMLLGEKHGVNAQMSLWGDPAMEVRTRPVPPEVSDYYMVAGCEYSDRLADRYASALVCGERGAYRA